MLYIIKILNKKFITHDTLSFVTTKPSGFLFSPGQATELSVNIPKWKDEKRPFTFTSLNSDEFLEFTIKIYRERNSVTKKLSDLEQGNELIIEDPWGAIEYKEKGVFIAGGAGITPFIAILRQLKKANTLKGSTLIFSNKTEKDIILKSEFDKMRESGLKVVYTLTRENNNCYEMGRINRDFLKKHVQNFNQNFYICGPITMVGELQHQLKILGADVGSIILET